jgi:hypothetical protein
MNAHDPQPGDRFLQRHRPGSVTVIRYADDDMVAGWVESGTDPYPQTWTRGTFARAHMTQREARDFVNWLALEAFHPRWAFTQAYDTTAEPVTHVYQDTTGKTWQLPDGVTNGDVLSALI